MAKWLPRCTYCGRVGADHPACMKAYDRHTRYDDGTLESVFAWIAKRAYLAGRADERPAKRKET